MKRKPPEGNVRVVRSTGENMTFTVYSKTGKVVQCESFGELCWLLGIRRNRGVRDFGSQPETFERYGHKYTPDFIVWLVSGDIEIHEITRSFRRTKEEAQRREQIGREICEERGWRFFVHTEEELPAGARLANLLVLRDNQARCYDDERVRASALDHLVDGRPHLLRPLAEEIGREIDLPRGSVIASLFHMLWHDTITTDLDKLLLMNGVVAPTASVWLPNSTEA
jgi:hypothetical protein